MSTFKICTYHVFLTSDKQTNKIYKDILNITCKINKKYCQLNNYSYQNNFFHADDLTNICDQSIFQLSDYANVCIFKYKYLLDCLENSTEDYIVFVEYDACFCNTIKKLEDYIDNKHSIFYSRCNWTYDINRYSKYINAFIDEFNKNINDISNFKTCSDTLLKPEISKYIKCFHNKFFCNQGFYIFKNNEISKKFLKAIIQYAPLFYDESEWITEGQVLQQVMATDKFSPHLMVLPPKTQGHIYGNCNKYNEDDCLIQHNASISKDVLYNQLVKVITNKYWKDIVRWVPARKE